MTLTDLILLILTISLFYICIIQQMKINNIRESLTEVVDILFRHLGEELIDIAREKLKEEGKRDGR